MQGLAGPLFSFFTALSASPSPLWSPLVPPAPTFSFHQESFGMPLFPHPGPDALQKEKTSHGVSTTLSSCPGTGVRAGGWRGPGQSVLGGVRGGRAALVLPTSSVLLQGWAVEVGVVSPAVHGLGAEAVGALAHPPVVGGKGGFPRERALGLEGRAAVEVVPQEEGVLEPQEGEGVMAAVQPPVTPQLGLLLCGGGGWLGVLLLLLRLWAGLAAPGCLLLLHRLPAELKAEVSARLGCRLRCPFATQPL